MHFRMKCNNCFTTRRSKQSLWSCLVIATLTGCGILLYLSYIYRGNITAYQRDNSHKDTDIHSEKIIQENCRNVCSTKECVFAASFLLENIDFSVDPCEDFYSFSCGNLAKTFSKQDNYSALSKMESRLKVILKDILDKLNGPPGSNSEKLKIVYDSCTSDDASELKDIRVVKEFLRRVGIEGWPDLSPSFEFGESSLGRTLGLLNAFDEFAFVRLTPLRHETDTRNSTNDLFTLSVTNEFSFMAETNSSQLLLYETILCKVLRYFGVNHQAGKKIWADFIKIDEAVFNLFMDPSSSDNEDTDDEDLVPEPKYLNCNTEITANMISLCETVRHFIQYSEAGHLFSKDIVHISYYSTFFVENIFLLLDNFTQSEVANYLAIRFVLPHLGEMSGLFRSVRYKYPEATNLLTGYKVSLNKWKPCLDWILLQMPLALAQAYVSRVFSSGQREELNKIVGIYLEETEKYISDQKWIDDTAKSYLIPEIRNTTNQMEYFLNFLLNSTKPNSSLDYFEPTKQSFLQNAVEYQRCNRKFNLIRFKDGPEEITYEYFGVNAYYFTGTLGVRVGMLLPPVYQHGLPKLLNLATMGTTLGHELGHLIGFFFAFSEDGEVNDDVKKIFEEKMKCLEEQYFEYEVEKIKKKVNGSQTVHENIADVIAIEITQRVIEKYSKKGDEYPNFALPGLKFSSKQLFYISLAQLWFSVRSKEKEQHHFDGDVHAPPPIRVTGMLRNLPEFSDVFNCTPGSKMNPLNRCRFRD